MSIGIVFSYQIILDDIDCGIRHESEMYRNNMTRGHAWWVSSSFPSENDINADNTKTSDLG